MAFYGPTFPNETHYDKLFSGRQRFGNRSANMFFVRPARHIACPRRLKYIHDIKTGIIPYVEDSVYDHRPAYGFGTPKYDDERHRNSGLGLYNSTDVWRQELMELAQQVKTSLIASEEPDAFYHSPRASRLQRHHPHSHLHKRSSSTTLSNYSEENDENQHSKRLLNRRISQPFQRVSSTKPRATPVEKSENELTNPDENQDSGIWLIPILCYVLQIDSITEAQEWLANANPTEKRLAMELISRTMQDMQNFDHDLSSDVSSPDSPPNNTGFNSVYWPYKIWQRQEKQRHYGSKLSKSISQSTLPSISSDHANTGDTCERATSPLRMLTPAKRSSAINNHFSFTPVDTMTIERSVTRQTIDRTSPSAQQPPSTQQQQQQQPQRAISPSLSKNASSTMHLSMTTPSSSKPERQSRRGYRVATSINHSVDQSTQQRLPTARGKTPLI